MNIRTVLDTNCSYDYQMSISLVSTEIYMWIANTADFYNQLRTIE